MAKKPLSDAELARGRSTALTIAKQYVSSGLPQNELDRAALEGLQKAVEEWPTCELPTGFGSFVTYWCRQTLKARTEPQPRATAEGLRGMPLVERAIAFLKEKTPADPLPESMLRRLKLGEAEPASPSIATWFSYQRFLPEAFGLPKGLPKAVSVEEFVATSCRALKLPVPKAKPPLSGLVHLVCPSATGHLGLWVGPKDEAGEYPVLEVREDEGAVSFGLRFAGFDIYLADWARIIRRADEREVFASLLGSLAADHMGGRRVRIHRRKEWGWE